MRAILKMLLRLVLKPALSPRVPVRWQRRWGALIGLTLRGPGGTRRIEKPRGQVPCLHIEPAQDTSGRTILYLHGGAHVMGGYASHRKLAAAIGVAAGSDVCLPDYRLAPEHPYPAALTDALAVYRDLLDRGQDPARLSLVGDSAGAGLSLALALEIRDQGLPPPACLVLLSPWVDLSLSGTSLRTHARRDPMLKASWLRAGSAAYRAGTPMRQASCSPLFAEHAGLPPVLIQVGSEEILLSDALRLHEALAQAGVASTLQRFDGLWHVFQLHTRLLAEADRGIADIGGFITTHTDKAAATAPEETTHAAA